METQALERRFVAGTVPHVDEAPQWNYCGPASVWMILKYYQQRFSLPRVPSMNEIFHTIRAMNRPASDTYKGIDERWIPAYVKRELGLEAFASSALFDSNGRRRSTEELIGMLKHFTEQNMPVISAILEPRHRIGHSIVVTAVDERYVYANDVQYRKTVKYTHQEFIHGWTEWFDHTGDAQANICVIAPPQRQFSEKDLSYYTPQQTPENANARASGQKSGRVIVINW